MNVEFRKNDIPRNLPHDTELEQALLGSLLVDNYWIDQIASSLKGEHFYDPLHHRIYETISSTWGRGQAATPLTIKSLMEGDPGLHEVGGHSYLLSIARAAPAIPSVVDYARLLVDLALRRALIEVGDDLVGMAQRNEVEPKKQIEEAEKALYNVAERSRFGEGPQGFEASLTEAVKNAELALARGGHISGVPSGFTDLDSLLGGLHASDLIIVAGRPGMGKTSFATNMGFHAARLYAHDKREGAHPPRGAPILMFSLEMAASQLSARILSEQSEIEMRKIRTGRFSDSEWDRFVQTAQALADLPFYIDDTGGISIAQVAARARRMKREKNIGLIMVDYLQLVEPSRRFENRVQEISDVTKGLKALAKELDLPVVAMSQLSRGVDNRDDKRPILSDLRESGSIEQDADVVMFVYREEYYMKTKKPDENDPGQASELGKWLEKMERVHNRAEILVEKHRHGPTNRIELFFDENYTRFSNLAAEDRAALSR